MPRREPYRPVKAEEIAALEARRLAGGFTALELAMKAGISERTYRNMRRHGRAWPRHIRALSLALRTLEQAQKREGDAFPFSVPSSPGGAASGAGFSNGSGAPARKRPT